MAVSLFADAILSSGMEDRCVRRARLRENAHDRYTVAVKREEVVFGHLLCKLLRLITHLNLNSNKIFQPRIFSDSVAPNMLGTIQPLLALFTIIAI